MTGGRIDAFVQSVGTAASVRGVSEGLREQRRDVHVVAVEPSESAVLSGGQTGVHRIEGVGAGFVVPLWDPTVVDAIETVSTEEARQATEERLRAVARDGRLATWVHPPERRRIRPGR